MKSYALVISILLILPILFGCSGKTEDTLNGATNSIYSGQATTDGKHIFFSKGDFITYRKPDKDIGIYRMDMDGSNIIQITNDEQKPCNIILRGDQIYYTINKYYPSGHIGSIIYGVNNDGSNKRIVKDLGRTTVSAMHLSSDNVFYFSIFGAEAGSDFVDDAIFSMALDGSDCQKLPGILVSKFGFGGFVLNNNYIYAINQNLTAINRVNISSGENQEIYKGNYRISELGAVQDSLYFTEMHQNSQKLIQLKADGTGFKDLGLVMTHYNAQGRKLIYTTADGKIMQRTSDGKETLLYGPLNIKANRYDTLCIAGDWVMFSVCQLYEKDGSFLSDPHNTQFYMMRTDGTGVCQYYPDID